MKSDKMAEALGCYAEYVEQPQDIRPAFERAGAAAKKGVPALIIGRAFRLITVNVRGGDQAHDVP